MQAAFVILSITHGLQMTLRPCLRSKLSGQLRVEALRVPLTTDGSDLMQHNQIGSESFNTLKRGLPFSHLK